MCVVAKRTYVFTNKYIYIYIQWDSNLLVSKPVCEEGCWAGNPKNNNYTFETHVSCTFAFFHIANEILGEILSRTSSQKGENPLTRLLTRVYQHWEYTYIHMYIYIYVYVYIHVQVNIHTHI